jgi:hypothetical protein
MICNNRSEQMSVPLTVSVPEWGFVVLGLGAGPSYGAAKRGDFAVIEFGNGEKVKRQRVPVRVNLQRLADGDPALLEALTEDFLTKWKTLPVRQRRRGEIKTPVRSRHVA